MFLTITTPSKFHPTRMVGKKTGRRVNFNHKWDDEAFSPKDGQRYLVKIWGKMRTAFKDNGIKVYGMRVVEPHYDATPHWHMMLFCDKAHRQLAIDIMRRYALEEDGQERGAQEIDLSVNILTRVVLRVISLNILPKILMVTLSMARSIMRPVERFQRLRLL